MKRAERAWDQKRHWWSQHSDYYSLALPMRNLFDGNFLPGADKNSTIYDPTLQEAVVRFANRLQSDMTPPFTVWGSLVPGMVAKRVLPPEQLHRWAMFLEALSDAHFAALHSSNFDQAVNEMYLDLSAGTGTMMMQRGVGQQLYEFTAIPQALVALESGSNDKITGDFRKHRISRREIVPTYARYGIKTPEGFDDWVDEDPSGTLELFEATYNIYSKDGRERWFFDVLTNERVADHDAENEPWRFVNKAMRYNPWLTPRWIKVPGEVQGRGPGLIALPDAKVLNKIKEISLQAGALAINPPLMARDDGVINPATLVIRPGVIMPVGSNGSTLGPSIQPLTLGNNFEFAQLESERLEANIKRVMLDDSLPSEDGQPRSATEFVARMKKTASDVGSPFGRMMREFIVPQFKIGLHILQEAGIVKALLANHGLGGTNPGQGSVSIDGLFVDVQVTSPLAQLQDLDDLESLTTGLEISTLVGPEKLDASIKTEDIPEYVFSKLGITQSLVRSEDEKQQKLAEQAQLLAAEMAKQSGGANGTGAIPAPVA